MHMSWGGGGMSLSCPSPGLTKSLSSNPPQPHPAQQEIAERWGGEDSILLHWLAIEKNAAFPTHKTGVTSTRGTVGVGAWGGPLGLCQLWLIRNLVAPASNGCLVLHTLFPSNCWDVPMQFRESRTTTAQHPFASRPGREGICQSLFLRALESVMAILLSWKWHRLLVHGTLER